MIPPAGHLYSEGTGKFIVVEGNIGYHLFLRARDF